MKIASSAVENELHAICLSDAGTLFHTVCREDGKWEKWEALHPGGIFRDVTCSSTGSMLHVIGVTDAELCVHRTLDKEGKWTEFKELAHQPIFE
jgi:hypothetical protein